MENKQIGFLQFCARTHRKNDLMNWNFICTVEFALFNKNCANEMTAILHIYSSQKRDERKILMIFVFLKWGVFHLNDFCLLHGESAKNDWLISISIYTSRIFHCSNRHERNQRRLLVLASFKLSIFTIPKKKFIDSNKNVDSDCSGS